VAAFAFSATSAAFFIVSSKISAPAP